MADPLSVSAGVVGLVVPALQGLRNLLTEVKRFRDVPKSIDRLKDDLASTESLAKALQGVVGRFDDPNLNHDQNRNRLESGDKQDNLKTALLQCDKSTFEFRTLLASWTRRSNGRSKLSVLDRSNISFLKHKDIEDMSSRLHSIKGDLNAVMSLATLRIATNLSGLERRNDAGTGPSLEKQARCGVFRLPFRRDPTFVDRLEMEDLESRMSDASTTRLALVGFGGAGKSQLAIEYCYRLRAREPEATILWINASGPAQYIQSLYDISKQARLNEGLAQATTTNIFRTVGDWLQYTLEGKWFVVLDSLDDAGFLSVPVDSLTSGDAATEGSEAGTSILDYLPITENGSILITSRSHQAVTNLVDSADIIEVEVMNADTAIRLLAQKANAEADEYVSELAAELDYVPLAMAQAAAYLNKRRALVSPKQLLQRLREMKSFKTDLLITDVPADLRRSKQSNSVFLTWQLAFKQIRKQSPTAISLLSVLSFFDNKNIPIWLLKDYKNDDDSNNKSLEASNSSATIASASSSGLESDLCLLQEFLFIRIDAGSDHLVMHDLVQTAVREWLRSQDSYLYHNSLGQSLRLLNIEFPRPELEKWPKCMTLLPHITKLLDFDVGENDKLLTYWSSIAEFGLWFAIECGFQSRALSLLPKLLKIESYGDPGQEHCESNQQEYLLPEQRWRISIAAAIAKIYEYTGDYIEAEKRRVYILEGLRKTRGASHPSTWTAISNLAVTRERLGRQDDALVAYQEVMEHQAAALGPHHRSTLSTMTNLAISYSRKGDYAKAGQIYEEVYTARRTALSEDHPETMLALWNVAANQSQHGQYAMAEKTMLKVVDILRQTYEPGSKNLLSAETQLGAIYQDGGKWNEAIVIQERVAATKRKELGEAHPDTLRSLAHLAVTYYEQGRYEMAVQVERDLLEKRKARGFPTHPDVLETAFNLSQSLMELDRLEEAAQLARDALKSCPNHLHGMRSLATILRRQGEFQEASALNARVLDVSRKKYSNRFPDTLSAICNLAASRRDEGLLIEAESLGREAVAGGHDVWGPEHPYQLIARTNLAETLIKKGEKVEARKLLEDVTEIRTRKIGFEHPDTLKSRRLLEGITTSSSPIMGAKSKTLKLSRIDTI